MAKSIFREKNISRLCFAAAIAYLVLLPLQLPFRYPLFVHDLLAPVIIIMVGQQVIQKGWRDWLNSPNRYLVIFLALAGVSTILHFGGVVDLYEIGIFSYMILLYAFFRQVSIPSHMLGLIGGGILAVMLVWAVVQEVMGIQHIYDIYAGTHLNLIANRFYFTFSNPNLTGSFYSLPIGMLLIGTSDWFHKTNIRNKFLFCLGLAVLCIPLALTYSKHMLLSIAIVFGLLAAFPVAGSRKLWGGLLGVTLGGIFLLFYSTVLAPIFPIRAEFPFVNVDTWGLYTIMQKIYLEMMLRDVWSLLLGAGRSSVVELYPQFFNWERAYAILSQYQIQHLVKRWSAYMDAHNEYLNLGTSFGILAVVAIYLFWLQAMRKSGFESNFIQILRMYFIVAVLLVSFWGDILSKRWIWVLLGLMMSLRSPEIVEDQEEGCTIQPITNYADCAVRSEQEK